MTTNVFCALFVGAMGGLLSACGSSSDNAAASTDSGSTVASLGGANPSGTSGTAQTPPTTSGTDVEAWLVKGDYKAWKCENVAHPQMAVSPHGQNRICSNDLVAQFTSGGDGGSSERPVGSASVKELYDAQSVLVGYAVAAKIKATSDSGAGWYWYERVPLDSQAPHDANGVVADGLGTEGAASSICVGCHAGAASDAKHTVTDSSDFVYLQVAM